MKAIAQERRRFGYPLGIRKCRIRSFSRITVDGSFARHGGRIIRPSARRGILHDAFLDTRFGRFLDREKATNQLVKEAISIDFAMELPPLRAGCRFPARGLACREAEVGAEIHGGVGTEMRVKDVMTTKIVKISPDNSVRQAAKVMLDNHVSGIPVVDDAGHLLGIISEGDLIRRTELGNGLGASQAEMAVPAEERAKAYVKRCSWKVGDAMTHNPVTIDEEASLTLAARLMQERSIKRIPVTRAGKLVGIVSRADLLRMILAAKRDETAAGDEAIRRSIAIRLGENTGLEGLDVKVVVTDGIVHLWGNVETLECRKAARIVAESVRGVRGVVEHFSQPFP